MLRRRSGAWPSIDERGRERISSRADVIQDNAYGWLLERVDRNARVEQRGRRASAHRRLASVGARRIANARSSLAIQPAEQGSARGRLPIEWGDRFTVGKP
jgi:hypothetical protein